MNRRNCLCQNHLVSPHFEQQILEPIISTQNSITVAACVLWMRMLCMPLIMRLILYVCRFDYSFFVPFLGPFLKLLLLSIPSDPFAVASYARSEFKMRLFFGWCFFFCFVRFGFLFLREKSFKWNTTGNGFVGKLWINLYNVTEWQISIKLARRERIWKRANDESTGTMQMMLMIRPLEREMIVVLMRPDQGGQVGEVDMVWHEKNKVCARYQQSQ